MNLKRLGTAEESQRPLEVSSGNEVNGGVSDSSGEDQERDGLTATKFCFVCVEFGTLTKESFRNIYRSINFYAGVWAMEPELYSSP